jgi:hypothetical protein
MGSDGELWGAMRSYELCYEELWGAMGSYGEL